MEYLTFEKPIEELIIKLEQAKEQNLLYQIDLQTGRFHQIRAQFAYLGAPIFGRLFYHWKTCKG